MLLVLSEILPPLFTLRSFLPDRASVMLALAAGVAVSFSFGSEPHRVEIDGFRVLIRETGPVLAYDEPVPVEIEIENTSETEFAGEVTIGGPTEGVHPVGETRREFTLAPGGQMLAEFRIAFDNSCLSGVVYPVHAFVTLTDGRDARVRAIRLIETKFDAAPRRFSASGSVVRFTPPPPVLDDGLFAAARSELLRGFVLCAEELPVGGLAYRLGDDLTLLIRPGNAGILDAEFSVLGGETEWNFNGLEFELELPDGVVEPGQPVEVQSFAIEPRENGFSATHQLRVGEDWITELTVAGQARGDFFEFRVESPDRVVEFGIGQPRQQLLAVAAGPGYRFTSDFPAAELGSTLLAASFAGFEFEGGTAVVQASDQPIRRLEGARISVDGAATLTLAPALGDVYGGAVRYAKSLPKVESAPGVEELGGKIWIQASRGHFGDLRERIAELAAYGVTDVALSLDHAPRFGPGARLPDVWPPDEQLGNLTELQELAKLCRDTGVLLGLQDDYAGIHAEAEDFSYQVVGFGPDGEPAAGLRGGYELRPDRLRPFLERNLKLQRHHLVPRLGVIEGVRLAPFFDGDGAQHSPEAAVADWRETLRFAGEYLGPDSLSVSNSGGGEWLVGAAAGAGLDPLEGFSGDRVPWLELASHRQIALFERSANPSADAAIANEILLARVPYADHACWGRALVRKAWLVQPVARLLAGQEPIRITFDGENPDRLRCFWKEGAIVWINRGVEPWSVAGREIPENGFLMRTAELDVAIEERANARCERMTGPNVWYANARSRLPDVLRLQPFVESVRTRTDGLDIGFGWSCAEAPPEGFSTSVILSESGREVVMSGPIEVTREDREDGSPRLIKGQARFEFASLGGIRDLDLSLLIQAANGRPVRLPGSGAGEPHSRFGGFAVPAGRISLSRSPAIEGFRLKYDRQGTEERPGGIQLAPAPRSIDFGFAKTDGAFRLESVSDGLRLIPLPDSAGFSATIYLKEIGIDPGLEVAAVIAKDLASSKWWTHPFEATPDTITIKHDPKAFSYAILLREKASISISSP